MVTTDANTALELARNVLRTEAAAIVGLVDRLDDRFGRAVDLLFECTGRVILTGMGKSGIICRKSAATLASELMPRISPFPSPLAFCRYRMWPTWRRSKQPLAKTIFRPETRSCATMLLSSSRDFILVLGSAHIF